MQGSYASAGGFDTHTSSYQKLINYARRAITGVLALATLITSSPNPSFAQSARQEQTLPIQNLNPKSQEGLLDRIFYEAERWRNPESIPFQTPAPQHAAVEDKLTSLSQGAAVNLEGIASTAKDAETTPTAKAYQAKKKDAETTSTAKAYPAPESIQQEKASPKALPSTKSYTAPTKQKSIVDLLESKGIEYPGKNKQGYDEWLKLVASVYFSVTEGKDPHYERSEKENLVLYNKVADMSKEQILSIASEFQKKAEVGIERDQTQKITGVYAKKKELPRPKVVGSLTVRKPSMPVKDVVSTQKPSAQTNLWERLNQKGFSYQSGSEKGVIDAATLYFAVSPKEQTYHGSGSEKNYLTEKIRAMDKDAIARTISQYQSNNAVSVERDPATGKMVSAISNPKPKAVLPYALPEVPKETVRLREQQEITEVPLQPLPPTAKPSIDQLVNRALRLDNEASKVSDNRQLWSIHKRPDHEAYSWKKPINAVGKFLGQSWDWTAGRVLNNVTNTLWDLFGSNRPTVADHFGKDNLRIIAEDTRSSDYKAGITARERDLNRWLFPGEVVGLSTLRVTKTAENRKNLALSNHEALKLYLAFVDQHSDFEHVTLDYKTGPLAPIHTAHLVVPKGSPTGLAVDAFGYPVIAKRGTTAKEKVAPFVLEDLPHLNRSEILGDNGRVDSFDKRPHVMVYNGDKKNLPNNAGMLAFAYWTNGDEKVTVPKPLKQGAVNIYELGDIDETFEKLAWLSATDPLRYWALYELFFADHGTSGAVHKGNGVVGVPSGGRGDRTVAPIIR